MQKNCARFRGNIRGRTKTCTKKNVDESRPCQYVRNITNSTNSTNGTNKLQSLVIKIM